MLSVPHISSPSVVLRKTLKTGKYDEFPENPSLYRELEFSKRQVTIGCFMDMDIS